MTKLSFGFIVGGGDSYYKNLMRACESLERIKQDHEIVIIDMDDRLEIDDPKVKIVVDQLVKNLRMRIVIGSNLTSGREI